MQDIFSKLQNLRRDQNGSYLPDSQDARPFIVFSQDTSLENSRILQATGSASLTDDGTYLTINVTTQSIVPFDSAATYFVLSATSSLSAERVLTMGTGLSASDGGAGAAYTIAIRDSVVATISGSTFTGVTKHNAGLSGSLTKLTDGTSFIKSAGGISVTSQSNGAITISGSASPLTNKGDIFTNNGTSDIRLASASNGMGLRINSTEASGLEWRFALAGVWGSGADGTVALDGTNTYVTLVSTTGVAPNLVYTLIKDLEATDLSVSTGKILNTAGYEIYVTGTLSGGGTIRDRGNAGSGINGGSGRSAAGSGSTAIGFTKGGDGPTTTAAGGNGTNGATNIGAAGGGGGGAGTQLGGLAGTIGTPAAALGSYRNIQFALRKYRFYSAATVSNPQGGTGGGSGAVDITAGGTGNGGGGGAGGGFVSIWAKYVTFTGDISVVGGAGAAGTTTGAGIAGGGGGGGGGRVVVHTTSPAITYTTTLTGGAAGNGSNGGSAGTQGGTGTSDHFVI